MNSEMFFWILYALVFAVGVFLLVYYLLRLFNMSRW